MFRPALLLLSGNAATSLLLLARNLAVAWLIPVADYGIAATFAIAVAVIEMASHLGLQQQIVQSRDGDDPRFQATLQGFQLLRGTAAAVILFVSAGAIAGFLGIPEAAWAYQVLAVWPLLNALQHFDIHRLNRQMRFRPVVLTGAMPALVSLLAIWPLALAFGDYRVMLWAIVLEIALKCAVSHALAERPYRLGFDRRIMAGSLRFGWPLLLNGAVLFAVFQGDKLIVGRELGMEALAVFAMGLMLTLTPVMVLSQAAQRLLLPVLSPASRADPAREAGFQRMATVALQGHLLGGIALIAATYLVLQPLVALIFGDKYAATAALLPLLAAIQTLRLFKGACSTIALSRGQTANVLIANGVRILSLPLAWWLTQQSGSLMAVLWVALVAEGLSYGIALGLIRGRLSVSLRGLAAPLAFTLLGLGAVILHETLPVALPGAALPLAAAGAFLAAALSMRLSPGLLRRVLARGRPSRGAVEGGPPRR